MATEYCQSYSDGITDSMKEVWEWTSKEFWDADKMSSPLQGATNKFLAELLQPKRSTTAFSLFMGAHSDIFTNSLGDWKLLWVQRCRLVRSYGEN